MHQPKRYCDLPNVNLDCSRIPVSLQPLYEVACRWGITCEEESYRWIEVCDKQTIQSFLTDFSRVLPYVESYIFDTVHPTPVPDEVVLFQMTYRVFMEAKYSLALRIKREI